MSVVKSGVSWLRQSVAWSNSWLSWQERLVLAGFLVAAAGLGVLSAWVQLWLALVLWAVYLVAFTVAAGTHTIAFQSLDSAGGDNTAFIDAVRVALA